MLTFCTTLDKRLGRKLPSILEQVIQDHELEKTILQERFYKF